MSIQHFEKEHKGNFNFMDGNRLAGQMTYSKADPDKIIIEHTEVNPEYNGKGVGKALVLAAVAHARQHQLKIVPLCPFANAVFQRNKDLQDVLI